MNSFKIIAALPIAVALSGCASPIPATRTAADLVTTSTTIDGVTMLGNAGLMPAAGTASYTGSVVAQSAGEGVIGDLALTVDFASNAITGSADNVNIIGSPDFDDQKLSGTMTVAGVVAGNSMTADMTGHLTGAAQGFSIGFDVDMDLAGNFKTVTTVADQVGGTVAGSILVTAPNGESDTINITQGTFAACVGGC